MSAPTVSFDPTSDAVLQQTRYEVYRYMREHAPVYEIPGFDRPYRMLFRYADAVAVLRSPAFVREAKNAGHEIAVQDGMRPIRELLSTWMLLRDPPDHTRLRALVSKAFTPRTVEKLRGFIRETAEGLLDRMAQRGRESDLLQDFAGPLPVMVIARLLGAPVEDAERFRAWARWIATYLGSWEGAPPEAAHAALEMAEYMRALLEERRLSPRDDLVSALLAAEESGNRLSHEEVVGTAVMLLTAGHETTVNLIANGTYALLKNPDAMRELRGSLDSPEAMAIAVEELLRFDAPVQMTARHCREEIEIGGVRFRRGDVAGPVFGSANRDPAQFPDPDRLDVRRRPNEHLAFGHGQHYCVGAGLARLEGQIAIGALLRRFPELSLVEEPRYVRNMAFRALEGLRVAW
ncbi:cytochrome P450 [Carboxydochorda subterranea]|uniref:Cytochrome P450 n=1 Tax=Carboxydichorda subterranea TaxID=3109565 RepID=A0ABZ1BV34_9FIRM|nr:cytochrome P450 [Limnochorda sp. L945t]WRP16018.1 cytochrome P450 [Limnochorda sp. L945t]